jgi:hypothetical protein
VVEHHHADLPGDEPHLLPPAVQEADLADIYRVS